MGNGLGKLGLCIPDVVSLKCGSCMKTIADENLRRQTDIVLRLFGRVSARTWTDWRWQMAQSVIDPDCLPAWAGIAVGSREKAICAATRYPVRITPYYLSLAHWDDADDPVLIQCLAAPSELQTGSHALADPLGESRSMPVPGLIRRYQNRAVLLMTNSCAVRCRHCNRKGLLPGQKPVRLGLVLQYLKQHPEIREVILSGGDPLLCEPGVLEQTLTGLRLIPSVEVLRIGTRVPVVLPMRVDRALVRLLAQHRPLWVNTHFNHPNELTQESAAACDALIRAGIPVSNQTVLLRGVNDSVDTLESLFNGLQRIMVRPYYLFECDAVQGAAHFRVGVRRGRALFRELRARLGGLSLPQYVLDAPGASGKTPLA